MIGRSSAKRVKLMNQEKSDRENAKRASPSEIARGRWGINGIDGEGEGEEEEEEEKGKRRQAGRDK
jgi:hypothetical protein